MVILEHDHTRQIMTMWVDSTNDHAIFLDQSETFKRTNVNAGRISSTRNLPGVVFRVPAITPLYPYALARSFIRFDLPTTRIRDAPNPSKRQCLLGCNSTTSCEEIERDSLPQKEMSNFPFHGCNVLDGFK